VTIANLGLLLAAALCTAVCGATIAETPLQKFHAANDALLRAAKEAEATGAALPRVSDPKSRPLFEAAFDRSILSSVDPSDVRGLADICSPSISLTTGYELTGLERLIEATPAPEVGSAFQSLTSRNSVTYQDEIATSLGFAAACLALEIPAVERFWQGLAPAERTDVRETGVSQMRRGITEIYVGALTMQGEGAYAPANRRAALDAATKAAGPYASALTLAGRKHIQELVDAVSPAANAEDRTKLDAIRAAMSDTSCIDVCAVADLPIVILSR
jgi:hypothetical protein